VLYDVYLKELACSMRLARPGQYRVLLYLRLDDALVHSPTTFTASARSM
jgi:hypothetical protein